MKGRKISNYNDGIVKMYRKKTEKNVKSMRDLEYLSKLPFEVKSIRQEDVEFALQNDAKINMKIETPDDGNMDVSRNAVIDGTIYGIIHIDRDKKEGKLYFYLQEVRKIDF